MPRASELIHVFDACFRAEFRTILVGGAHEPVYRPSSNQHPLNCIYFTRDYMSSALHECAHWCVAGPERRKLEDYGYWYEPDGRSAAQQQAFEHAEVKPQALEWLFSEACGIRFRVSADNLSGGLGASKAFERSVAKQAQMFCREGVSARPQRFIRALNAHFSTFNTLDKSRYLQTNL